MARKNPFANLSEDCGTAPNPAFDYPLKGASKSILSSIDELVARSDKLIQGETIVELNPNIIHSSFVEDRLSHDGEEFDKLLESIRERGQNTPILIRPHPTEAGSYMVVFGHRRLLVAKMLGRNVRAIVKDLKDVEHVIFQGQENSLRANLSFIEKAYFAANLIRLHFDEDNAIVLSALAVDRATLSKMLSVTEIPKSILKGIGPAKGVGRDPWYQLKLLLDNPRNLDLASNIVNEERFSTLTSNERFNYIFSKLKQPKSSARANSNLTRNWAPKDGLIAGVITVEGKKFSLALKAKRSEATEFGHFLYETLDKSYEDFKQKLREAQTDGGL